MRAALIATVLAATAAPPLAAADPPANSRAPTHEAPPTTVESPATPHITPPAAADARSAMHDPPLIAYALELADTGSRTHEKEQYIATTNLRAVTFDMSRHPPPGDKECAHTLGASRFAEQYARVARIQDQLGNFEAVIEANESAFACQPRVAWYQASIASAHLSLGHIDEARVVVERGYAIDPEDEQVRDMRAHLDFIQERWADATARFRLQVVGKYVGPDFRNHARCYLWLAQRRAGVRNPELPQVVEDPKDPEPSQGTEWPAKILDTLRGEMTEEALVQVIREDGVSDAPGMLTEALFYVGELKLADGDSEAARRYFASVVNLKVLSSVEYGMARAELKKMRDRSAVADAATAGTQAR